MLCLSSIAEEVAYLVRIWRTGTDDQEISVGQLPFYPVKMHSQLLIRFS